MYTDEDKEVDEVWNILFCYVKKDVDSIIKITFYSFKKYWALSTSLYYTYK